MAKIPINLSSGQVERNEEIVVGIDLGTTNSLVAYTDDDGQPFIIQHAGNHNLMPSIVYFDYNDKVIVGKKAENLRIQHPERSIFSIKRLMGKSWKDVSRLKDFISYKIIEREEEELVRVQIGRQFYSPTELSSFILRELKVIAEQHLGTQVSKAVITVPAYFNDSQRQATKDAGKIAGLDVLRIVNEPTAASLAFGLSADQSDKTIAVYDLGGGTFDVSILNLSQGIFEVVSTHGDTFLGGDDFDYLIYSKWANQFTQLSIDYNALELRLLAESAKKKLANQSIIDVLVEGQALSISRDEFQEMAQPLIDRTITSCQIALKSAGLSTSQIDEVILVGGSTRMIGIKAALATFFGKEANSTINPDEAVALGAAIQADILSGRRTDTVLLDVTPLSLGIETVGGLMDNLLSRNSKIPAAVGRNYTTSVDGQKKLKVAIYQGERDLVKDNRKLAEFILDNIPSMPAGIPKIEIKFIIDADGILQVVAKELRSGIQQDIKIKPQYGISEEEMGRMLLESIQHAKEDIKIRTLIEAQTEGESIVLSTDRFLSQNESWLSMSQIAHIQALKNNLVQRISSSDKNLILEQIEELNQYAHPLAHEALDRNISENLKGQSVD